MTNNGAIAGGFAGGSGPQADAITFTGGDNRLGLRAGSDIQGVVDANSGNNRLALGGSADATFDVSTIGDTEQYQGYQAFEKTGSSIWTLTGTTDSVTPWTINQGLLSISSDDNLGAASGGLTFNGGGLQSTATLTTARDILLNADGGTFATDEDRTATGVISGPGEFFQDHGGRAELTLRF